jgi:hypothetical protein
VSFEFPGKLTLTVDRPPEDEKRRGEAQRNSHTSE